ncbi:inner membrane protein YiaA [Nibribacter koreensis]|uniref:Inner membrane protein YiaA n=1 Tax=Nibribacter koreensis TaxID=1084519 RepID=A0ABP8FWN9_9BACT
MNQKPSNVFAAASYFVLLTGISAYIIGLWNADMMLNEKGYYFTILMYGLFSAISLQKSVRDQLDGIPVSSMYYGLAWFSTIVSLVLLTVGLWNADLFLSEKGFYGMSFLLSLFAAITVQKNTRDSLANETSAKHNVDGY